MIEPSPTPTLLDPSGGVKQPRGDHWVDGSGQNFRNPWPSYQDRVSDPARTRADEVELLVLGFREFTLFL
jgi:hypothetical protein